MAKSFDSLKRHSLCQVSEGTGVQYTEDIIIACLKKLFDQGLVSVYLYDSGKQLFIDQHSFPEVENRQIWFFITEEGRKELDANWEGED